MTKTRHRPLLNIGKVRIGLLLVWLFVYLILLIAGGCTQTEVEEDVIPPHALKEVEAGFNLNVLANQTPVTRSMTFTANGTIETDTLVAVANDTIRTRATSPLSEVQESQIASLWVGQYDAVTGVRLFSQYIPSMTDNTVNMKLKQSQSGAKSHVWFVANAGDLGVVANEKALKGQVLAYSSTEAGLPDNNLCKMTGYWEGVVQEGGVKKVTVNLTRLLARITFTYSMGDGFVFTPTSVVLRDAPTVSQVEVPATQLTTGGISYKTYIGTASQSGATVYWYLPENMAGTVSGDLAVDSEMKKIGAGVINATCIELTGNAVQGRVNYKDVTFRFYPGSNHNNYDIIRNSHYTMSVMLIGIDVSDERITVGKIPPIEVDPTEMPAKKGGEKEIQITVRPGQPWVFDMPVWLSALLDGKEIPSGATITHKGPANVVFRAVEANPRAEKRTVSLNIDVNGVDQEVKITQSGSALTKGNDISLSASGDSEGSSSFTATEGLPWLAALSSDGWLGWSATNPGFSGDEAPAGAQILKVKASSSNPSAQARTGKITVKAGSSIDDASYSGLKEDITVRQAGSTVTVLAVNNIAAQGVSVESSFTATKGLPWIANVTSGNWISLTGGTSGSPTTGAAQKITFDVVVNPSSTARNGEIAVRAGDTYTGPTGKITVNQSGATLGVSAAKEIEPTASTGNTSTFTATPGLSWNVGIASTGNWLTLTNTVGGTNNTTGAAQNIIYAARVNPNAISRKGTITVKAGNAVSGTDAGLTKTITVTQKASSFSAAGATAIIAVAANSTATGSVTATAGLGWTVSPATHSGITVSPTSGNGNATLTFTASVNNSAERTGTFTVSVTDANPVRAVTVSAKQISGITNITINNTVIESYKAATKEYTIYPPFNYDGGEISGTTGSDRNGVSSSCTLSKTYSIEVEKTERGTVSNYATAVKYCKSKGSGWRVPTMIELKAMYDNQNKLQSHGCAPFISFWYWSSSVYWGYDYARCILRFNTGDIFNNTTLYENYVRCVRDI